MNNSTAWLDCLAFEESGIKAFGCFGKRSAYLMSKEKDGYNNDEHVFEYRTDNEGYIREITVTTNRLLSSIRRIYNYIQP